MCMQNKLKNLLLFEDYGSSNYGALNRKTGNLAGKKKFTEDDINEAMDQYHPVWSPVLHKDDKDDILFLDLHY